MSPLSSDGWRSMCVQNMTARWSAYNHDIHVRFLYIIIDITIMQARSSEPMLIEWANIESTLINVSVWAGLVKISSKRPWSPINCLTRVLLHRVGHNYPVQTWISVSSINFHVWIIIILSRPFSQLFYRRTPRQPSGDRLRKQNDSLIFCRPKPKGCICSHHKWADTAFWLFKTVLRMGVISCEITCLVFAGHFPEIRSKTFV